MKDFTRVCRIEPQAVGAWLKQTSVKSNFQHVVYTIFFRRPQKKTLIFGIPSNFKYYSTELRTKHTLVAMVRLQPFSEDTFGGDAQQRYFVRPVHYQEIRVIGICQQNIGRCHHLAHYRKL
jgi:hypothetical protein